MPETMQAEDLLQSLQSIENEIGQHFGTTLANDAMLSMSLALEGAEPAEPATLLEAFSGSCLILPSTFEWNSTEYSHFFFIQEEEANALLAQIVTQNDAIDNLEVIFENWNSAATAVLQLKLDTPPTFGNIQSETRALAESDFPEEGLWLKYNLQFGENSYPFNRIVPSAWQEILQAAGLQVSEVNNIDASIPDMPEADFDVKSVDFGSLDDSNSQAEDAAGSLELLYDLKLDLVVELGRTRKPIREILDLGRGSIVELEKLAGDPVDIYVNDKKLAEGEVVVVDDHFGVRITSLAKPADRIRSLGDV